MGTGPDELRTTRQAASPTQVDEIEEDVTVETPANAAPTYGPYDGPAAAPEDLVTTPGDETSEEIEEARSEIVQTRQEMSETIEALREKLNPQALAQQAKDSVREATVGRAQHAVSETVEKAQQTVSGVMDTAKEAARGAAETAREAAGRAGERARDTGASFLESVKRNPMPLALAGIGVGWWAVQSRRPHAGYYDTNGGSRAPHWESQTADVLDRGREKAAHARERAAQAKEQLQEKASHAMDRVHDRTAEMTTNVQHSAREAKERFQTLLEENPLAVALGCAVLGVVVGMLIPETPQERRLMGEARDNLASQAQQVAQKAGQKAQQVAEAVTSAAKEEMKQS